VDLPKATALEAERIVEQLQLHRAPARSAPTIVGKDLITIKHSMPKHADAFGGKPQSSKSPVQEDKSQTDKSYFL
jgi:hypothetical protein